MHVSTDYVFDGSAPLDAEGRHAPYVESDPTGPSSVYGQSKLAGERAGARASSARHAVVRTAWLYGVRRAQLRRTRCCGWRASARRCRSSDDQIGSPTWTGHLAPALLGLLERGVSGLVHLTGAGAVSWNGFAAEIFRQAERPCRVEALTASRWRNARRRARRGRCLRASVRTCCRCRIGATGWPAIWQREPASWDDARMRLLVCGGAGFIGSHFARVRVHEHGDAVTVLDKLTYAGREENLKDIADAAGFRFVRGGIEDPEAVAQALTRRSGRRRS